MYIRFLSLVSNDWSRLDQAFLDAMCNPLPSVMDYWKEIINDEYCAVAKAFLYDKDGNIEGVYIKDF